MSSITLTVEGTKLLAKVIELHKEAVRLSERAQNSINSAAEYDDPGPILNGYRIKQGASKLMAERDKLLNSSPEVKEAFLLVYPPDK